MDGESGDRGREHLRLVHDAEPRRPGWWTASVFVLNVAAVGFLAWIGYEQMGIVGALVLTAIGLTIAYGYRHAASAAGRVADRRRPSRR